MNNLPRFLLIITILAIQFLYAANSYAAYSIWTYHMPSTPTSWLYSEDGEKNRYKASQLALYGKHSPPLCSINSITPLYSWTQSQSGVCPLFPGSQITMQETKYKITGVWAGGCIGTSIWYAYGCRQKPILPFNKKKSTEFKSCNDGSDPKATNPVRISTGEKIQTEIDYQAINPSKLNFIRYFSSHNTNTTSISPQWTHNYEKSISFATDADGLYVATATRDRGRILNFVYVTDTSTWISETDSFVSLTAYPTYYELQLPNDIRENYNLNGQLTSINYLNGYQINLVYNANNLVTSVSDNLGNNLVLSYNASNQLFGIITPDNRQLSYSYVSNKLDKVTNVNDATFKTYIYDDTNQPEMLSGIIDERGNRYASWTYDSSNRVLTGEHANGVEKVTFVYNADGSRKLTNSNNQSTTYSFNVIAGVALSSTVIGPGCASCGTGDTSYTYDPLNGNLLTKTSKGITTQYSNYDTNHNAQTITEAFGTPESRTTSYIYDSRYYSRVATKTEPSVFATGNKITTYRYDIFGNVTHVQTAGFTPSGIAVNRTVALQYNGPLNQLTQIDGPRSNTLVNDITILNYYLNTVVNGNNRARLKNVTQGGILLRSNIQYSASGKVRSETRTNGLNVSYSYYASNDRLETYTEAVGVKSRTTRVTYLPTGEVQTITLADGTPESLSVTFAYDSAKRLTSIKDAVNNRIEYVLDSESNVTDENVYDNSGTNGVLKRTLHQVFDVYSRLMSVTRENEISGYTFAPDGTLQLSSNGDGLVNEKTESSYQYDGLKRLTSARKNITSSDPAISNLLIQYGYDVNNKLTSVTDPKNGITTYVYDDLGNLLTQTSPDSGLTRFINDEAGNRTQQTDANNVVLSYSYDGLNRIKSITGINAKDNITIAYDTCVGGQGRLCGFNDVSGQTKYQYDGFGRTTDQSHTELGISYNSNYVYNLLDRVTQITLPSGRVINKTYNTNAQVTSIDATVGGTMTVLIDNAQYAADGQLSGFTYGNGYTENRIFDMAGRIVKQNMPQKRLTTVSTTPDTTAPLVLVIPPVNIIAQTSATVTPIVLGTATATTNNVGPRPLRGATLLTNTSNALSTLSKNTFSISARQQSIIVIIMVTDEQGKTLPPKAWYQAVKQGRWEILDTARISNLEPDVMMVVSDTKIDLWQANTVQADGKTKLLDHQQQTFNGKAWSLRKAFKQVNHVVWSPSQANALLRPEVTWQYSYDTRGNITSRTVDTAAQNYIYNALDRITSDVFSGQVYAYDKNGNRNTLTTSGTVSSLTYEPNSNRLTSNGANTIVLDNVGNTTSDGNHSYGYNIHNRLTSVDTNITYVYNALGQRTRKVTQTSTIVYHYDRDGQLQSETTETGGPIKDYVYLDNQPIAQLSDVTGQPGVAYVHTDHLKTPRAVTDSAGKVIWTWATDAFGSFPANRDPDGDGVNFEFNLRFAGQYFDRETGLHYNYFRYYDPQTGRYITSDPIGLNGGLNTFGYVGGNPLYWSDPYGLRHMLNPTYGGNYGAGAGAGTGSNGSIYDIISRSEFSKNYDKLIGSAICSYITGNYCNFYNNESSEEGDESSKPDCLPEDDYPENPDDWTPPEDWTETSSGEHTGGKNRQWVDSVGNIVRRWDREGREGGKQRDSHWHDSRRPGVKIPPTR